MKVLYAAWRYDPRNPDLASGVDYNFSSWLIDHGVEITFAGPFLSPPCLLERIIRKSLKTLNTKYIKYDFSTAHYASKKLEALDKATKPDIIFSLFPPPLLFYEGPTPIVYGVDTTFLGWQEIMANIARIPLMISVCQENKVLKKCARVITYSTWSKNILINKYKVPPEKIKVIVMPSGLDPRIIPSKIEILTEKRLEFPIRLLLVGRDYYGKGVDTAIETNKILNSKGIDCELTVCGVKGENQSHVSFVGPYRKNNPEELQQYIELYKRAHFLIHPSLFEGAGIVPGEAAAFATPTITNDTSALSTTVQTEVSGIVLPHWSKASLYAETIAALVNNPNRYYDLCMTTRIRYEMEIAGQHFFDVFESVRNMNKN
jgi:glycosyltransferase involved in cell wall biosynthesis